MGRKRDEDHDFSPPSCWCLVGDQFGSTQALKSRVLLPLFLPPPRTPNFPSFFLFSFVFSLFLKCLGVLKRVWADGSCVLGHGSWVWVPLGPSSLYLGWPCFYFSPTCSKWPKCAFCSKFQLRKFLYLTNHIYFTFLGPWTRAGAQEIVPTCLTRISRMLQLPRIRAESFIFIQNYPTRLVHRRVVSRVDEHNLWLGHVSICVGLKSVGKLTPASNTPFNTGVSCLLYENFSSFGS